MASEDHRRESALTDEKSLEVEKEISQQTSSSSTKSELSKRASRDGRPEEVDPEKQDADTTPAGIVAPDDEKLPTATEAAADPNIVDWEEGEQGNPQNWPMKKKWATMAIVSSITFLTPLASSMVAPGVQLILRDFNSTSQTVGSFVVSIYVLGYALGPLFVAPMSEVYGRLPVYHICNVMFTVWTIACAVAPNIGSLLAFRLFAGIAGSCPITIGGGSIADVFSQKERGGAMALFALGPLFGPVIGPVAGGYLAQAAGWRWVFWVLTIAVRRFPLREK
jgi:multidrug resistance protein